MRPIITCFLRSTTLKYNSFTLLIVGFVTFIAPITPRSQETAINVYCVGDSITWGQTFGSGHDYPKLLNQMFEERGVHHVRFFNQGQSGDTVGDRLAYWSGRAGTRILERSNIHWVTIMLGTNDTRIGDETPTNVYVDRMNALIDVFINHTNLDGTVPQVILSLIPPHNSPAAGEYMASQFADRFVYRDRIPNELNPALLKIAEERNLRVIDCYTPIQAAGPDILPDGLHPDREGNELLAQAFFAVMFPLLVQESSVSNYELYQ